MLKTELGVAVTDSRLRASNRDESGRRKGPTKGSPVASSPSGTTPLALSLD